MLWNKFTHEFSVFFHPALISKQSYVRFEVAAMALQISNDQECISYIWNNTVFNDYHHSHLSTPTLNSITIFPGQHCISLKQFTASSCLVGILLSHPSFQHNFSHCPQLFVATEEKWAMAVDTSLWASIIRVILLVYVSAPVCSMCVCGFLHVPEAVVLATRKFVVTTAALFGLWNVFSAHEFITIHA